jgi:hypothetical protein
MDAKTIRGLVWLAALSLFCATTAWVVDHAVFASVFFALGAVAVLGAAAPQAPALTWASSCSNAPRPRVPPGQWSDDDYDVLKDDRVVGRIFKANAAPIERPWMWTLAFDYREDRTPTHGYEATRVAAMAAFAKS